MLVLWRVPVSFERLSENHFLEPGPSRMLSSNQVKNKPRVFPAVTWSHGHSMGPKKAPVFVRKKNPRSLFGKAVGIFNGESMLGPTCYKTQTRRKNKTLVKLEVTNNL